MKAKLTQAHKEKEQLKKKKVQNRRISASHFFLFNVITEESSNHIQHKQTGKNILF